MCCFIKAFNVETCMIKDGRILENFSSKDKIAAFPISNGKMFVITFFKEISYVRIVHRVRMMLIVELNRILKCSGTILQNVGENNYRV